MNIRKHIREALALDLQSQAEEFVTREYPGYTFVHSMYLGDPVIVVASVSKDEEGWDIRDFSVFDTETLENITDKLALVVVSRLRLELMNIRKEIREASKDKSTQQCDPWFKRIKWSYSPYKKDTPGQASGTGFLCGFTIEITVLNLGKGPYDTKWSISISKDGEQIAQRSGFKNDIQDSISAAIDMSRIVIAAFLKIPVPERQR